MTRIFSALAATAMTVGLLALHAGGALAAQTAPVRTISMTEEGKPILLARMVVTATALPNIAER